MNNLTLYSIETTLLELLALRDEVQSTLMDDGNIDFEALDTIDVQIREYCQREVQKADGIAAYLRECDKRHETLAMEANRIHDRADAWRDRHDRLEDMVIDIMQQAGKKKIEGNESTLSLRKNPPSVEVAQPDLVPHEYQRITITLSRAQWINLVASMCAQNARENWEIAEIKNELNKLKISEPEPNKKAIGEALKQDIGVPGARLRADKVRLVVE